MTRTNRMGMGTGRTLSGVAACAVALGLVVFGASWSFGQAGGQDGGAAPHSPRQGDGVGYGHKELGEAIELMGVMTQAGPAAPVANAGSMDLSRPTVEQVPGAPKTVVEIAEYTIPGPGGAGGVGGAGGGDEGVMCHSYIAYPAGLQPGERRPGVLVCPEWWGCNDYAKERAIRLAELGYVALAVDVYGGGKVTDDPKQAGAWAGELMKDVSLVRQRARAGLEQLKIDLRVDTTRLAAIGYCLGGTVALELARDGEDLDCVVAFHSGTILARDARDNDRLVKSGGGGCTVLLCHGADDGFVQPGHLDAFHEEMRAAGGGAGGGAAAGGGVDYEVDSYAGAVHSFTNPGADAFGIPGVKYNARADHRSWERMKALFREKIPFTPVPAAGSK
ncbi:MAG: dienelactone hydrolase family protein [Phycisphaerales bacterium]